MNEMAFISERSHYDYDVSDIIGIVSRPSQDPPPQNSTLSFDFPEETEERPPIITVQNVHDLDSDLDIDSDSAMERKLSKQSGQEERIKMNKKLSKTAMNRLKNSEFFHDIENTVKAWDYYLLDVEQKRRNGLEYDAKPINEMLCKWEVQKLALEYITGNLYGFSRNGDTYSVVNERDYNDRIISGSNHSESVRGTK